MPSPPDPPKPRREDPDGPVFAEAWHAQVLALAHALTRAGMFTAAQWSDALGAALRRREARAGGEEHLYYAAAIDALERLVDEAGTIGQDEYRDRVEAWRDAYLRTPHGQPVELGKGRCDPARPRGGDEGRG